MKNQYFMKDLQVRLRHFAVQTYQLSVKLREDGLLYSNLNQLVRSSASILANYSEAQSAASKKDFNNKIRIGLKEARESLNWLRYFGDIYPEQEGLNGLTTEAEELCKILTTIALKTKQP